MSPLVFRPIAAVTESFGTSTMLACIRSLTGMRSLMNFQILQTRKSFLAAGKLETIRQSSFML